jgi:carbamoyltransferase
VILGVSISHCSSACLVDLDGTVVGVASEERFSRRKNESGFPEQAIRWLLGSVNPREITRVAFGARQWAAGLPRAAFRKSMVSDEARDRLGRNAFFMLLRGLEVMGLPLQRVSPEAEFRRLFRGLGLPEVGMEFVDHHLCHAASALYTSGLDEPLLVTVDGIGDGWCASVSVGGEAGIETTHRVDARGSPGYFYSFVTALCGFSPNRHEGKVTGLAAFGDPRSIPEMEEMLALDESGDDRSFLLRPPVEFGPVLVSRLPLFVWAYARWLASGKSHAELTEEVERLVARTIFRELLRKPRRREDLAACAQRILEERVSGFVAHYARRYAKRELALAGGVFANVKLNQRLFNLPEVDRIFIHPGMGDEGTALGAAYQVLAQVNPGFKRHPIRDVYLGPAYSEPEVEEALRRTGVKFWKVEDESALAEGAAARIAAGQVLGLFRGRMEYGPRALGARSVLADPRRREMHDRLNRKMRRSEFMPFAPVLPAEQAYDILDGKVKGSEHAAEFMTITYAVRPAWRARIPAVVHVDGTARPQLLRREVNPFYYGILRAFERRTGVPVLINTSFNMHEEPIVCTPQDALRAFAQGGVDAMVMERYVVEQGT